MKKDRLKWLLLSPITIYALVLILLPIVYIFILSFQTSGNYGEIIYHLTFYNYLELIKSIYLKVFLVSFGIASITTIICMIIAFPFAYFLREKSARTKTLVSTLVMLPFLTNSLIRLYGWIVLLRKTGIINTLLMNSGITDHPLSLMYNTLGTCIGMVYTLLPFMILPLISACEKIDNSLIEASHDLGASKFQTFINVVLPQVRTGLFNGSLMVFIPSIGYFFISDILGGGKVMLIGNLIKNQFYTARNWPFGSSIAIILIIMTFILIGLYKKSGGKMDDLGGA
jgi:spermidine/putrescine transport system permease protein